VRRRTRPFVATRVPQSPATEYPPQLHRYLVRRLRNRDDAQDLAQETYLRFLQLPDPGVVRNPAAYLFRIAFNLITEWRLRNDRSVVSCDSGLLDKQADPATDEPEPIERLLTHERLEKVLERIPGTYRRVLLMSKCDGLSNEQIAEALNIAPETVTRYLGRAMAFARRAKWD